MGCACFARPPKAPHAEQTERFQTTVSVLLKLSLSATPPPHGEPQAAPQAPLAPLAKALRHHLHELCARIEAPMRGVAMLDVQLQAWPPQRDAAGVVFFLALVDHGLGPSGAAGAARLCSAVASGTAKLALFAALAREPLPQGALRVDALQLTLPPLAGTSPVCLSATFGGGRVRSVPTPAFARVDEEDEEASQRPGLMARRAMERAGSRAGSFCDTDFWDGSVHTGYWQSVALRANSSGGRACGDERHSPRAAAALAERAVGA